MSDISFRDAANTSLKSLNVSSNNIGDKGATLLAEALKVRLMHQITLSIQSL